MDRRKFISGVALTSASLAISADAQQTRTEDQKERQSKTEARPGKPVIISKYTGIQSSQEAYQMLLDGRDTLDAVVHMLKAQEDDPNDETVGLGGLPNSEGVVELDSCVMHGPTRRAGSVGGLRNIKNACLVARAVMEHTGHVMLVGEGAERFGYAMGFPKENLLTDHARRTWLLWKESHSDLDWWGPTISDPNWKPPAGPPKQQSLRQTYQKLYAKAVDLGIAPEGRHSAVMNVIFPPTGTIHVSVVNAKGEMSGGTTTSGLSWKIPGRVGDSPIIGAGCYTDQDVGSAGATGSGEENIKVCGAHSIVENMRRGMSPQEAGLEVLKRVARTYNYDKDRLRYVQMVYYILRKDGAYAGVSLWSHSSSGKRLNFQINDGTKRLEDTVPLYEGTPIDWPPDISPEKAGAK